MLTPDVSLPSLFGRSTDGPRDKEKLRRHSMIDLGVGRFSVLFRVSWGRFRRMTRGGVTVASPD